jgi:hypothetical protein
MRRLLTRLLLLGTLFGGLSAPLAAQAFPDLIKELGITELARDYLRPGADAIGYSINSGLYHSARIDSGLQLWIGLRGVWSYAPESDRTFLAKLPSTLTSLGYPSSVETATLFGGKGAVLQTVQTDPNGQPYPAIPLPDGIGISGTFLLIPHATIGSIAGTELMLRGLPPVTYDPAIGKISFFGVGLRHSPTSYIRLPIDIAFMAAAQEFSIGEIIHATAWNVNAHASIPLAILEAYGGVGYESYTITAAYAYTPTDPALPAALRTPQHIALDFERVNFRFTLGVNLIFIPLIDVNAEYSFGVQDNLTVGAGLRL